MTQIEHVLNLPTQETIERVKNKIWRKSHSLNSVMGFERAVRQFVEYMEDNQKTYSLALQKPLQVLDDFANWLDTDHAGATTRTYIAMVKKLLLADGAVIDHYRFREEVVLPKPRDFQDDKVNEEQIRSIVLAIKNQRLKCLLMLMKDTAARPTEILGLRLRDFNLSHDPAYIVIPEHLAKNDLAREVFFTTETKNMVIAYLQDANVTKDTDYVFLKGEIDTKDEKQFQRKLIQLGSQMVYIFRYEMQKPQFKDLCTQVEKRGKAKRYKIHIYSFKKFAFTRIADELGELAAYAVKGDKEYALTYYRKSREERAEDYRKIIPKLSVFSLDEQSKIRKEVEQAVRKLSDDDLARLQKYLNTANA